jgi:hypothetical protein
LAGGRLRRGLHHPNFPLDHAHNTKRGLVSVEKVKVGDLVLSRNRATGKLEYKPVTALTKPHQDRLFDMRIEGEVRPLHPTADHPFWVKHAGSDDADWVEAGKMQAGDFVQTIDGKWHKVVSIAPIPGLRTVYNFEVESNHDYFVGVSGELVHNSLCNLPPPGSYVGVKGYWVGQDGYEAAVASGATLMTPSQAALDAATIGDNSLLAAESAQFASTVVGENEVAFIGEGQGSNFFNEELPEILSNIANGDLKELEIFF